MREKTVLAVLFRWDYGQRSRGESGDKLIFFETLKRLVRRVEPLWFDEHLNDPAALQQLVVEKAEEVKPDLIFFVPYKDEFSFETLDRLKSRWSTYAWFGDDQWRFESFTRHRAPHYTFASTTDPLSVTKYAKLGIRPIVTQWAADPDLLARADAASPSRYRFDVSFVGMKNDVRHWFVKMLSKKGVRVDCFGHGWENGPVSFSEMGDIFRDSRININLSNSVPNDIRFVLGRPRNLARALISKKNREQVKARNFEIPMAGGFQLSKNALGLERYFDVGREIAVFDSPEECAEQIHYYLHEEEERLEITRRSHERAQREHSYQNRLESILDSIFQTTCGVH
jgi:spore maturation protein CgeB